MKILMALAIVAASMSLKAEDTKAPPKATTTETKKLTTKDAKKTCKEMGKTGDELIQCMKEKKDEK